MSRGDFIVGLGRRSDMVRASTSAAGARGLSPDETRILSRIGAGSRIGEVIAGCGLPESAATALLVTLRMKGLITLLAAGSVVDASAPELAEDVELDLERKREILDLDARLGRDDHFTLLGIGVTASDSDAKRAYYDATKKFHPDRHYGKRLGSYAERVNRIFKRLTEAFEVLSDAERRAAYLNANPHLRPATPGAGRVEVPLVDQARAAERRARVARHPYLARQARVAQLLARGEEQIEKNPSQALSDIALAAQLAPGDKKTAQKLAEARTQVDASRAAEAFDDAVRTQTLSDAQSALGLFRQAASLDPKNAKYADRAAKALVAVGGDPELKEARALAQRATELEPRNADYHANYGAILQGLKSEKLARREFEVALELDPNHAYARAQIRKMRWQF